MLDTRVYRNRSIVEIRLGQRTYLIDGRSIAFTHASLERLHDPADPLSILEAGPITLQHLDPFWLLKARLTFLDKTLVDRFLRRRYHLLRDVCPRIDRGTQFLHCVLSGEQEWEHVGGGRALTDAFDDAIAYLLR